ncbi:MAG: extracellular solute-binding protein [Clostridiaceae bacterium]|nr:extracellular solute-binding protein [Clostridiaceae bacterium]
MRKKYLAAALAVMLLFSGCQAKNSSGKTDEAFQAEQMNEDLLAASESLPKSEQLYFEEGLQITGLGVTYDGRPTSFDGCYYFPAIETMTGVHVSIDWQESEGYSSAVATTLLVGKEELPDIINPTDFGVMELADDGLIIPLDAYLDLMPDIVRAVGEEHMDAWRSSDGHIYTIPSVSTIRGSFSMMLRQDWLEALEMDLPETWQDWLAYWKGVRDNDLNSNGDPSDEIPFALAESADGERCLTLLLNAFGIAASNDTQFCVLEDGTYTMIYEHPRYPAFLEAMSELYAEGILVEGYESFSYASIEQAMGNNTLGSTMTFAASGAQTNTLRESGVENALWISTQPVAGPYGDRMIQERELISPIWCITAGAYEKGKAEDIIRFFNWCYTEEGSRLYNYGIEGVSYTLENGEPVLDKALITNGFTDYRAVGINYEPFGGYWLQDAYMQCLFAGKTIEDLTDVQYETYNGLFVRNNAFFYAQPLTIETESYVKYRAPLITDGVCKLRDQAIRGEISLDEFWSGYETLKERGLADVIADADAYYRNMMAGGVHS